MSRRVAAGGLVAAWPAGVLLAGLSEAGLPLAAVVAALAAYVVAVIAFVWRLRPWTDGAACLLAVSGPGLFAAACLGGIPTADRPGAYQFNTAVLILVTLALLVGLIRVATDDGERTAGRATPALVLFAIGAACFLANLLARVAVVLSGAAGRQAAAEDRHWVAYSYLRGLDSGPDFMGYLLVWFDLLQLGYVATAYLAAAAVARLLAERGRLPVAAARWIAGLGSGLASALVGGAVLAMLLPRHLDLVPAWAVFVVSIPFFATLLPTILGAMLLARRDDPAAPATPPAATTPSRATAPAPR